jgi:hypothetical protein
MWLGMWLDIARYRSMSVRYRSMSVDVFSIRRKRVVPALGSAACTPDRKLRIAFA